MSTLRISQLHVYSRIFQIIHGLPDPIGSLNTHILSQAIVIAHKEVEKALKTTATTTKQREENITSI